VESVLQTLPAVVVLCVVVGRVGMVKRPGSSRTLWLALAFLGVSLLFYSPPVYNGVDRAAGSVVTSSICREAFGLGAAAGVRALCSTVAGRRARALGRDWLIAAIAVVIIAVPLSVAAPAKLSPLLANSGNFYDSTWRSILYLMPCMVYLSWALGTGVVTCWRYGKEAPRGAIRTGLRLVGVGCVFGFSFVAVKVTVLTVWQLGDESKGWMRVDRAGDTGSLLICCALIAAGCSWEALALRFARLRAWVWASRSLAALRPVWVALAAVYPTVTLVEDQHLALRRSRWRLLRRVVEIRDAILMLGDDVGPDLQTTAAAQVAQLGYTDQVAEAMMIAVLIHWAGEGAGPEVGRSTLAATAGGDNLESEVKWLRMVARAYRRRDSRRVAQLLVTRAPGAPIAS
jgi:hypothetical protein